MSQTPRDPDAELVVLHLDFSEVEAVCDLPDLFDEG
jgi:hypothetical protein